MGPARMKALATGVALLAWAAVAQPALAGQYYDGIYMEPQDRVYADSFGNLVVHSRSGYKRIIVGQGHMAARLRSYTSQNDAEEPQEYGMTRDEAGALYGWRNDGWPRQPCHKPAVILHGRGYMYGLPDGYVPTPTSCYQ